MQRTPGKVTQTMQVEFMKAHTGEDGRNYTVGQIADISDQTERQNLVRQGIAKDYKPAAGQPPVNPPQK